MKRARWQSALIWVVHAVAVLMLVLEFAGPAWSQPRDPFRPTLDPRERARDPRDVGNRSFFRRELDPRVEARDPRRVDNLNPRDPALDPRVRVRDTVRPAVDAVPLPRLPEGPEVKHERLDDVRAVDLGLQFASTGGNTLLVEQIAPRGVIARAGIRPGDRIVSVNRLKVTRESEFLRYLLAEEIRNETLDIVVLRGELKDVLQVEPALVVAELTRVRRDPLVDYGLHAELRDPERLVVLSVRRRSPAHTAGLRPGDVILTFDDRQPLTREDLAAWIEAAGKDPVNLLVQRNGRPVALEWESDIATDATSSPSTGTTVPDRKGLERLSRLREQREMLR